MGEDTSRNVDPRTGSQNYGDWVNRASNVSLINKTSRTLFPVQEMLPFQRQLVDGSFTRATLAINQAALFDITVPEKEAWSMKWITVEHTDPGGAQDASIFVVRAAGPIFVLMHRQVGANLENNLYPGKQILPASASSSEFDYDGPMELFEGDTLSVRIGPMTGASVADCALRYEHIPAFRQHDLGLPDATTTVV